jgi:hypothetical protein
MNEDERSTQGLFTLVPPFSSTKSGDGRRFRTMEKPMKPVLVLATATTADTPTFAAADFAEAWSAHSHGR